MSRHAWTVVACGVALVLGACSVSTLVGDPTGRDGGATSDAATTVEGALALYQGAVQAQASALSSVIQNSGLLSDELVTVANSDIVIDTRRIPEDASVNESPRTYNEFQQLQHVRAIARQARGVLQQYAPASPIALRGHLYAIEAMADIALAEGYCSGIPLSTVDYDGGATLRAGVTSDVVYETAIGLLDSALTLSVDSARILDFARVAKGRALLGLGRFADAATAVTDVPTNFRYLAQYATTAKLQNDFQAVPGSPYTNLFSVVDGEGAHGLPFGTNGDWRTDTTPTTIPRPDNESYTPRTALKYAPDGATPIILASGVEARLIEAEADLRANGVHWLEILNALRTTCTWQSDCSPLVFTDTLSPPPALPTINDPGIPAARVDTLFADRAAWLYLTGHRASDLRRLVRQYGRAQTAVFPTGPYTHGSGNTIPLYNSYGSQVNFPVPREERTTNSLYTGCIDRGA